MKIIILIYGLLAASSWGLVIWEVMYHVNSTPYGIVIVLVMASFMTFSWLLMSWAYNQRQQDKISAYMAAHEEASRQYREIMDDKEEHDVAMAENQAERYPE